MRGINIIAPIPKKDRWYSSRTLKSHVVAPQKPETPAINQSIAIMAPNQSIGHNITLPVDMSSSLHSMPATIDSGLEIELEPAMNRLVLLEPNHCPSASVDSVASSTATEETKPSLGGAARIPFDDDDEDFMASKTVPQKMIEHAQEEIETRLASELNQLSMKERDDVFNDIHGVADIVEETPELLEKSLLCIQQELDKIISQPKKKQVCAAYLLAKEKNPHYVLNPKFLVTFLRSESFHPPKAALRLLKFLQEKLTLFGPEKVGRDILLSDLDSRDLKSLESGFMQLLPARDRAGRAIICGIPPLRKYKVIENLVRNVTDSQYIYWRDRSRG